MTICHTTYWGQGLELLGKAPAPSAASPLAREPHRGCQTPSIPTATKLSYEGKYPAQVGQNLLGQSRT